MADLSPFEVGQIIAHRQHGLGPQKISELVQRDDGSRVSRQAVKNAMDRLDEDPSGATVA